MRKSQELLRYGHDIKLVRKVRKTYLTLSLPSIPTHTHTTSQAQEAAVYMNNLSEALKTGATEPKLECLTCTT